MGKRADNLGGSRREALIGKYAGEWRVQFTQIGETGQKTRLSRIFSTKTEAKQFLRELQRGLRIEEARKTRELTLGEWFEWQVESTDRIRARSCDMRW